MGTILPIKFDDFQMIYASIIKDFTSRNGSLSEQDKHYIYQLMNLDFNYCSVKMDCIMMNAENVPHYKDFITCLEALCCMNFDCINFEDYGYENCKYIMEKDERLRKIGL